ncbi:Zinc-finger of C2H2 type/Pre-mRNA-splicing factor SF3a complex subunit 2 (Prp11), putative [Angomonas deanei]|uniref:Zinc-finger of C2H2 type/Pre-mRNA-splicing factor SF3a complex subunit 2 (Prp11), putative n=1 Tax=Angomonas deanei TaxID=59799 RepID=A0A7G2C0B5_9TRYP|nr:Zinc-finger of C2H2 type/Pre-mRNA-splicing factor SF3a complex subunit 2 (Prp11), putative [Angomonas deanei]
MASYTDTVQFAKKSEYYKINHLGKVLCTLCNVYCSDENNFIKHLSGKTHLNQIKKNELLLLKQKNLEEEEKRSLLAQQSAEETKRLNQLLSNNNNNNSNNNNILPTYTFKTEHDPILFQTKVYLEIYFDLLNKNTNNNHYAETRPLHRWLTAREAELYQIENNNNQNQNNKEEEYYVYLLVACEGYQTSCFKFPSEARRSAPGELISENNQNNSDNNNNNNNNVAYHHSWDPIGKVYSLFFVMSR